MSTKSGKRVLLRVPVSRRGGGGAIKVLMNELKAGAFALSSDEVRFVETLLEAPHLAGLGKSNLWVYRPHQAMRSGDFVIVDLSSRATETAGLDVFVVELKRGAALKTDGRCSGMQLTRADEMAMRALAQVCTRRKERYAPVPRRLYKLVGDRLEVLNFFRGIRGRRRGGVE